MGQKIPAREVATDREVFGAPDLESSLREIKGKKFIDFVNVKDFGAVGDGVTDDTEAIQNVINYVKNNKVNTIYIPEGTYIISNTLNLDNNKQINIKGVNTRNTFLKFIGSGTLLNAVGSTDNRIYFKIKDISLWNDENNNNGLYGLEMEWNSVHTKLNNVDIRYFRNSQLRISNNWQIKFDTCLFNGVPYTAGDNPKTTNGVEIGLNTTTLRFFNCTADNNFYGFNIKGGNNNQINECVFQGNANAGIYIISENVTGGGSISQKIQSCYFEKGNAPNTTKGINIIGDTDLLIQNPYIINNSFNDIPYQLFIKNVNKPTILSNKFDENATEKIEIRSICNNGVFINNVNGIIKNVDNQWLTEIRDKKIINSTNGTLIPMVDINMNIKNIFNVKELQIKENIKFDPINSTDASNNSIFLDTSDMILKQKDNNGSISAI